MRFGLKDDTVTDIQNVFVAFPEVDEVILYGSRAMGNYKNGSDIDLVVKGRVSHAILNNISIKLDGLFLPYTFDISALNEIDNPDLLASIRRDGICFYKNSA